MVSEKIWYVSKYAIAPLYGNPSRQFFFSKYMAQKNKDVTLISSRSVGVVKMPKLGFVNQHEYIYEGVKGVLLNGSHINLGFNFKRIISWGVFEIRFLYWALFKNKEKPDLIIVSSLSLLTFLSGFLLKKYFKCKLICEVRDIWPLTIIETKNWSANNIFIRFLSFVERIGYKNSDAIIGTMPNLVEHVKNVSLADSYKVNYIPTGFDEKVFKKNYSITIQDPFEQFFSEKISEKNFVVGYAGTLGFVNCVDQIIEASNILKKEPISFVILGNGVLKEQLKKKSEQLNLKNIFFLKAVQKQLVPKFLEKCDLLLNPWMGNTSIYKYGVSPNKWIDYMYSARPILVSLDGYHNIINEAKCGKFIKADDPIEMARTIMEFRDMDQDELKLMGERGKLFLLNNLNYNVLADKYIRIIEKS